MKHALEKSVNLLNIDQNVINLLLYGFSRNMLFIFFVFSYYSRDSRSYNIKYRLKCNKLVITWFFVQYVIYFSCFFLITLTLRARAIKKLEK